MRNFGFWAFVLIIFFSNCVSHSKDEPENTKNIDNVELSDIKGCWEIRESSDPNVKGINLLLDDRQSCTWTDQYGNPYVGPYYFFENMEDQQLQDIGEKLYIQDLNKIHISQIKIIHYLDASHNPSIDITCDLLPFLACRNWVGFIDNIDYNEWSFWAFNDFKYQFDIVSYSTNDMELKLRESSVRFCEYENRYPLRLKKGCVLKLSKVDF